MINEVQSCGENSSTGMYSTCAHACVLGQFKVPGCSFQSLRYIRLDYSILCCTLPFSWKEGPLVLLESSLPIQLAPWTVCDLVTGPYDSGRTHSRSRIVTLEPVRTWRCVWIQCKLNGGLTIPTTFDRHVGCHRQEC